MISKKNIDDPLDLYHIYQQGERERCSLNVQVTWPVSATDKCVTNIYIFLGGRKPDVGH